jgi:hypothetical protein
MGWNYICNQHDPPIVTVPLVDSYVVFCTDGLVHLKGRFFGLWSNPVARGTGFLQFGLTIRHF